MDNTLSLLTGLGVGAGMMYILDPRQGRRRRAIARDKAMHYAREAEEALEVVGKDMRNRAQGLAAGDFSVLAGGRRALEHPLSGSWSPSGRALLAGLGVGLFIYSLTKDAPLACIVGTAGCALIAEGITNAGIDDITAAASQVSQRARDLAGTMGMTGQRSTETAAARSPSSASSKP